MAQKRRQRERPLNPIERTERFLDLVESRGDARAPSQFGGHELRTSLMLRREGIIDDADLEAVLDEAVEEFRADDTVRRSLSRPSEPPKLSE